MRRGLAHESSPRRGARPACGQLALGGEPTSASGNKFLKPSSSIVVFEELRGTLTYAPEMFFSVKNKHVSTHMSELVLPGRCRSESAESVALSALAPHHRAARLLVSGQMPVAMAGAMRFEMAVADVDSWVAAVGPLPAGRWCPARC